MIVTFGFNKFVYYYYLFIFVEVKTYFYFIMYLKSDPINAANKCNMKPQEC